MNIVAEIIISVGVVAGIIIAVAPSSVSIDEKPPVCVCKPTLNVTTNTTIVEKTVSNVTQIIRKPIIGFYPQKERRCGRKAEKFTITGMSMQPAIWEGDTIYMEPVDGEDVELGDVIRFEDNQGFATIHAVIGTYRDWGYVSTAGYANPTADGKIYYKKIMQRECVNV